MNYKHLYYFMQVAEAGSVVRAGEQLHLTPQTISGQLQQFEDRLGVELFVKSGRRLELTETGRMALDYARDIFALGAEFEAAVRHRSSKGRALEFRVGVADAVHKAVAYHLFRPALDIGQPVRIVCREWRLERLLAELALHRLDLVISDNPIPASVSVRAYNHRLGASRIAFFATRALRKRHARPFPACLNAAPVLIAGEDAALSQRLRRWFIEHDIHPQILGEFDDASLVQEFGRRGVGFFAAPVVLAREIEAQHGVVAVGEAEGVEEEFFAITVERRITNPCVAAVTRMARGGLFEPSSQAAVSRRVRAR